MKMPDSLDLARQLLRDARRVAVLTGAGISAESGIPTFRGPGGLWRNFRPEQLATPEAFARDPQLVWEWYNSRRVSIAEAEPNAGHRALVQMEKTTPEFTLITQNVDGLHERAGSRDVLRLHGSIWMLRCTECPHEEENYDAPLPRIPPRCACGALLRPGVVWFGEGLPADVWDNAEKAVRQADLLLVAGTSAVVYPAASLVPLGRRAGARVIEINPEETPLSSAVDCALRSTAAVSLPLLLQ